MKKDNYVEILKIDKVINFNEQNKFLENKSAQQVFLEKLLSKENRDVKNIADIACGNGSASYWLKEIYKDAKFTLIDLNDYSLQDAKENLGCLNFEFVLDDIYNLESQVSNKFDLVINWQTLSWLSDPEKALKELIRVTKKGGKIYISSLFNLDHDVDIYSKVFDWTRTSTEKDGSVNYNTYSLKTINKWLDNGVEQFKIHRFEIDVDLPKLGRGLGTYTINTEDNKKLQISAGILMNWGILEITK